MKQSILFNNATQAQIDETLTTLLAEGKPIVLALQREQSRNLEITYDYYILLNQGSYFQSFMADGGDIYLAPGEGQQYVDSEDIYMA